MRSCPRCDSVYSTSLERCGIDGEQLIDSETDPLVGKAIERYVIKERLGAGAMGLVYRAKHTTLDREHAVKVLFGELASNRTIVERFRREAKSLSRIEHPNIVSVTDFGATPKGLLFLVMELVRGTVLSALMNEWRSQRGPLEPARISGLIRQIASGLAAAHRMGFVHRDLKPGNIMIMPKGDGELVKILDFGIVGIVDPEADMTSLTKTGYLLGTPIYMAPEQVGGAAVGPSADLYSPGVILYEMLAGRPPFIGSLQEVLVSKVSRSPEPLTTSLGLEHLAMGLLEREPVHRPKNAEEIIEYLDQLGVGLTPMNTGPPRMQEDQLLGRRYVRSRAASSGIPIPSTYVVHGTPRERGRGVFAIASTVAGALALGGILWAGRYLLSTRNEASAIPEPLPLPTDAAARAVQEPVLDGSAAVANLTPVLDAGVTNVGPRRRRGDGEIKTRYGGRNMRKDSASSSPTAAQEVMLEVKLVGPRGSITSARMRVTIDGEDYWKREGPAPLGVPLRPGMHHLIVEIPTKPPHDKLRLKRRDVRVEAGKRNSVSILVE